MVKKLQVDCLSEQINAAVVRMPGRTYPGVVIQGDTLQSLCELGAEALESADARKDLLEKLLAFRDHYESVLVSHGMQLPY
jgi:hypothetical protein